MKAIFYGFVFFGLVFSIALMGHMIASGTIRIFGVRVNSISHLDGYEIVLQDSDPIRQAIEENVFLNGVLWVNVVLTPDEQPQLKLIDEDTGVVLSSFNYELAGSTVNIYVHLSDSYFKLDPEFPISSHQEPYYYTLVAMEHLDGSVAGAPPRIDLISQRTRAFLSEISPSDYAIYLKERPEK